MTATLKAALLGGLVGALGAVSLVFGAARLGYFPPPSDSQFHAYLMAHPLVIFEMQAKAIAMDSERADRKVQDAIDKLGLETFFDSRIAYVTGPQDAKRTVVEFFDYNCGHCRNTFPVVRKFYETHRGDTRFAFIELPIFGEASENAARSAIAARRQPGKYVPFHFAMMSAKGAIGPSETVDAARVAGLDLDKLMADLKDPEIQKQMTAAHALAERIHTDGTPFFIINGKAHSGEVTAEELEQLSRA